MTLPFLWELELIRAIQTLRSPALDLLFRSITSLGNEDFYFLLLPLLLWCVDFAIGARLAAVFLVSTYINVSLKDLFRLPRPFVLDPSVRLYDAEGYGMPSGHAQLSVVIWGTLAHAFRKAWLWLVAGLLAALIGFSRIYLGVHFPTDVLAGWLIGAALVAIYIALQPRVETWLEERGFEAQLVAVVGLPMTLVLLHATEDTVSLAGILLGAGVSIALLRRRFDYAAAGPLWKRVVRFLLGMVVLVALRFGLKALSPQSPEPLRLALRFTRYAILGLWIALGAPWLFNKLQLAPRKE
jgi:membrane-associated phospholipid phosphatase